MAKTTVGQVSILSTSRPGAAPWSLGWTGGTSGSLEIRNDFSGQPINFLKGANPLATLDANGNFSIGQTSTTNYFGIGTATPVLWYNGNPQDIFVAVGAGIIQ